MYQLFNFDDRFKKNRDALATDFLKELLISYADIKGVCMIKRQNC